MKPQGKGLHALGSNAVSEAEAASWGDTAGRYVSAELKAFDPVMDPGDAYGGRKGTWGDLAHHSYPQALSVAAAY